jgi:heme iron utilization protein
VSNMAHRVSGDLQGRAEEDAAGIIHAPEPTHAERARTLVWYATQGSLATVAKKPEGYPFGSVVSFAIDDAGRPLLALSDLAEHSKNLAVDPKASLLVTETDDGPDPLASGRVTLIGPARQVPDTERDEVRERYLAVHPHAYYVDFDDFALYRLEVEAIRYVGGFGIMSWIDLGRYATAEPDPVRPGARAAIDHMNTDHADAVRLYAEVLAELGPVFEASIVNLDRYGFDVQATTTDGTRTVRIPFGTRLDQGSQVRDAMIRLLGEARARNA